jgi:hypothetical protein
MHGEVMWLTDDDGEEQEEVEAEKDMEEAVETARQWVVSFFWNKVFRMWHNVYGLIGSICFHSGDAFLVEAESVRTALETDGSIQSFFAGSEEEWRQFTNDQKL